MRNYNLLTGWFTIVWAVASGVATALSIVSFPWYVIAGPSIVFLILTIIVILKINKR